MTSAPARPPASAWRLGYLLRAPHRLAFFLATLMLLLASVWWLAVLAQRVGLLAPWPWALSPTLAHGSVMVYGFMPLYFAGFLFTAGPKWLAQPAPEARDLLAPLLVYTAAWPAFLLGAARSVAWAALALLAAALALAALTGRLWRLIRASVVPDRVHAKAIGVALVAGVLALVAEALALLGGADELARLFMLSALWAFIVPVFVVVAHRMLPFFTSSVLPFIEVWRPFWVLWLMLAAAALELASLWLEALAPPMPVAQGARAMLELAFGGVLIWLAVVWGLVQSLRQRLLAMLHLGFVWLGLAEVLAGATRGLSLWLGTPVWPLAALHALTMGCLGSLILAMVTRVSSGHSGRPLAADGWVWALFWVLQLAVLVRLLAASPGLGGGWLLAAAGLWVLVMLPWGLRHLRWYGQARADGRAG